MVSNSASRKSTSRTTSGLSRTPSSRSSSRASRASSRGSSRIGDNYSQRTGSTRSSRLDSFLNSNGSSYASSSLQSGSPCTARSSGISSRGTVTESLRSLSKKKALPVVGFQKVTDLQTKFEIRQFLDSYSKEDNFDAFTINIDSIPFVAVSLFNADSSLRSKFVKVPPPTPMKPSTGKSSPRKRMSQSSSCLSSGIKPKSVRFDDEEDEEISPASRKTSESMIKAVGKQNKEYLDLWADRRNGEE